MYLPQETVQLGLNGSSGGGFSTNSVADDNLVEEIVVTPGGMYHGQYDGLYGGGGGGGGSTVMGDGNTLGNAAYQYADAVIYIYADMADPKVAAWYSQVHKAIATLYMKAFLNPYGLVDGPGAHNMTGMQVMQSLMNITIELTSEQFANGAESRINSSFTGSHIAISVPMMGGHEVDFGIGNEYLARNYVIFHELGHSMSAGINYYHSTIGTPNVVADNQAFANGLGYSLAGFTGEVYPTLAQLGSHDGYLPF